MLLSCLLTVLEHFAKQTNVDTDNRLICCGILDLGKQLMPIGMLVVLDSILNRITQNRAKGKQTFIFIDEIYLLFSRYSANFLFTLWKRVNTLLMLLALRRMWTAFCRTIRREHACKRQSFDYAQSGVNRQNWAYQAP